MHESEARFQSAFEHTNVAMVLTDLDNRFVRVNAAFLRLFGYSQEEMLGMSMADVTHPDHLRESYARREPLLAGQVDFFQMEKRYLHKDGHVFWGLTNVSLVRGPDGEPVEYVGQVQDITERKQAEESIVRYNERLKILHQIDRALIAGQEPGQIAAAALPLVRQLLGVGRAIVNLFDLEKGEVEWLAASGRRRVRVGPGVRYSMVFMGDVEALRKGEPQFIDVHTLPAGPEVDALLASGVHSYAVAPMIAGGELIGALSFGGSPEPVTADQVGIVQEVATQFAIALTQARLLERIKRQAQDLEVRVRERTRELEKAHAELQETNAQLMALTAELKAANGELESFSYSVSHDLRAPLRAINGFSRILVEKFAAQLPDEAREHLLEVRDSAREMGQLVDDLLAFSRLGRQAMRMQAVHQDALVRECLEDLRAEQTGRQVEISLQRLVPALGDAALLKQVWMNLLSNALKYTGKKDVARIEIGSQESDEHESMVIYYVRDNGVGFDMRYAGKLFGVFQRLHRAEEYEGTGVGLAIVQRIVHRHGGRVWADARLGEGATFFFTLKGAPFEQ